MANYMSILQLVKTKYLYQKIHRSKKNRTISPIKSLME